MLSAECSFLPCIYHAQITGTPWPAVGISDHVPCLGPSSTYYHSARFFGASWQVVVQRCFPIFLGKSYESSSQLGAVWTRTTSTLSPLTSLIYSVDRTDCFVVSCRPKVRQGADGSTSSRGGPQEGGRVGPSASTKRKVNVLLQMPCLVVDPGIYFCVECFIYFVTFRTEKIIPVFYIFVSSFLSNLLLLTIFCLWS